MRGMIAVKSFGSRQVVVSTMEEAARPEKQLLDGLATLRCWPLPSAGSGSSALRSLNLGSGDRRAQPVSDFASGDEPP